MIEIGKSDEHSKLARSQTDPLWLQDYFLATGHGAKTRNGTASFVAFQRRQFAVTCRHVMKAVSNPEVIPGAHHPTIALQIDMTALNLSFFTAAGLQIALKAPEPEHSEREVDIAIAELTGSYWALLTSKKGKRAIDLDNWREPNWAAVKMCAAAGYPDDPEYKETGFVEDKEMLAVPMFLVVAEVAAPLTRDQRIITLSSRLKEPHGYYFSGVSGGTLYTAEDDILVPAGIVFEGYPSSKNKETAHANNPTYLDNNDLFIRALTLTPQIFQEWLGRANLIH